MAKLFVKSLLLIYMSLLTIESAKGNCYLYENDRVDSFILSIRRNQEISHFGNIMMERRRWLRDIGWVGENRSFNNKASYVMVYKGCSLIVYEDCGFGGRRHAFITEDNNIIEDLRDYGLDNTVSSAICYCNNQE